MSSDEGSISEGESETSHDPDYQDEDSTTSNETEAEEEFHEILTSGCAGETEILSKGQRRRILAAAKGISEAATAEAERRSCPEKVPRIRRLRTGYKILEIYLELPPVKVCLWFGLGVFGTPDTSRLGSQIPKS